MFETGKKLLYLITLTTLCVINSYAENRAEKKDNVSKSNLEKILGDSLRKEKTDYRPEKHPEFNGKIINSVKIVINDIFDESGQEGIYRAANAVKIKTREFVVRRELLFKEGEEYDDFKITETERELREIRFLRDIKITRELVNGMIDITVSVKDSWTLIPQITVTRGGGTKKNVFGLAETNFLGFGKRVEILKREVDNRSEIETVYEDPRLFGTSARFYTAYFDRDDGELFVGVLNKPFRTFLDKNAWNVSYEDQSLVSRLYENANERFLFRKEGSEFKARYFWAKGDPEKKTTRYSLGVQAINYEFSSATDRDFEVLNVDPTGVSRDPKLLAEDREFNGIIAGIQEITPEFISLNYIDRFERVEDYNLGREASFDLFYSPTYLGSIENALHFNGNRSGGLKYSNNSFFRYEVGGSSRYASSFENSLIRGEGKYYNVMGPLEVANVILGKHTFATNTYFDYGINLDKDREFIGGGDSLVRGYDNRAFSGDKRLGISIEDRIHFVDDVLKLFSVGGVAFFDAGGASNQAAGRFLSDGIYSSVGFGLRLGFPRSSGGGVVRVEVAIPLRNGRDGTAEFKPAFNFSVGQFFSAKNRSEMLGIERANTNIGFER